jgi:hypothetical protein
LSGFVEYDYYNFGTRTNTAVCAITFCGLRIASSSVAIDVKETKSVFKVGLNVRWGAWPVVAKY